MSQSHKLRPPKTASYPWGQMSWFADDDLRAGIGLSLAEMKVLSGQTSDAHSHDNCFEAIHVLSGSVLQSIGTDELVLSEGETCIIPPGIVHFTTNRGPKDAILMLSYSVGTRNYTPAK